MTVRPDDLAGAVHELIAARATSLSLDRSAFRLDYVLNWGGFVNCSYTVGDPSPRYHLKLATEADAIDQLRTWSSHHHRLTQCYHAPPVVDWIDLGPGVAGLLFPHLPGQILPRWTPELQTALAPVLGALHHDQWLAERLPGDRARSCADDFREDFLERFAADLGFVAQSPPPFVDPARLAWMHEEVDRLASAVTRSAAFAEPAASPIHGDLWPNNVLVCPAGDWYLLDWDDCRLGDPVLDLVKLFDDPDAPTSEPTSAELAAIGPDRARIERATLYRRAVMLDWIIDPLADYLDADQVPEHADTVRAEKTRQHHRALARYRATVPA